MSHLADHILRRYIDEPDALLSYEKEHLLACTRCRALHDRLRSQAVFAATMLQSEGAVDERAARRAIHARMVDASASYPVPATSPLHFESRFLRWGGAVAAAFALFLLLGYTPLQGYAQNFLAIFEPHQFQPIGFTSTDISKMEGLPDLKAFGSTHYSGSGRFSDFGGDTVGAARFAGQQLLRAHYLPAGVPTAANYQVSPMHTLSFTFNAAKSPSMPPNIQGSTLSATLGPVVIQMYGDKRTLQNMREARQRGRHAREAALHSLPEDLIVVTQAPTPRVYSTGATVVQIEAWLLAQPGLPPSFVQQIRAIGDPTTTLPVPIRLDRQNAQNVAVQGTGGLLIGDNTGVGSVVIWQKAGIVHAVAGPYAASQILAVANSLAP
ncbi:MAG: hypothetical protein M3N19_03630 [Candidatus Eremiobacteraeota bacterium]|nr:hypothetical protein [Candidatus Eremiobacteraeota bacterium]